MANLTEAKLLLNVVDDLYNLEDCKCSDILLNYTKGLSIEDCNEITMLLGMCVNRDLTLRMTVRGVDLCKELGNIANDVLTLYRDVIDRLVSGLLPHEENPIFLKYLNELLPRLTSAVPFRKERYQSKYIAPGEVKSKDTDDSLCYTAWDIVSSRQAFLHDQMRELLPSPDGTVEGPFADLASFTLRYKIDLPMMYVVSWLFSCFCVPRARPEEQGLDDSDPLSSALSGYMGSLNDQAKELLFRGTIEDKQVRDILRKENGGNLHVDFEGLLPTIQVAEPIRAAKSLYSEDEDTEVKKYPYSLVLNKRPLPERQEIFKAILSRPPLLPCLVEEVESISKTLLNVTASLFLKQTESLRAMNAQLEEQKQKLQESNAELEQLQQEKTEMVDYYAHSWKHISYPTLVKSIAEDLFKIHDGEFLSMANRLMQAYNSEQTLKHGIQLLQYSISSSASESMVRSEFGNGFYNIDLPRDDSVTDIESLFEISLGMVAIRLMMGDDVDSSNRMKRCRMKIPNLETLREEYTDRFLREVNQGEKLTLLEWLNTRDILNLRVEFSPEWKAVIISKESFSAAQVTAILVELLTNMLEHGAGDGVLSLETGELSMDICTENACTPGEKAVSGSNKGISTLRKIVNKINVSVIPTSEGIETSLSEAGDRFSIRIRLDKSLVYRADNQSGEIPID